MPLSASTMINNHLGLITYGGQPRQPRMHSWSASDLLPMVAYQGNAGRGTRYFDGLVFEPGCDTHGGMVSPRYMGMAGPASREGWQEAADALFADGSNAAAVMDLSRKLEGRDRFDCWVVLPYPLDNQQQCFGNILGQEIDFYNNPEGRLAALIWWMKSIQAGWRRTSACYPGHRCRLRGFVWMKNSMDSDDRSIIADLSNMLSQQHMELMWFANYGTTGAHEGSEIGFHRVCLRPTFFGSASRGEEWINRASIFASKYNLGMMVWEPFCRKSRLDTWLSALHQHYKGGVHVYEIGVLRIASWHRHHHPFYDHLYSYMASVRASLSNRSDFDEGLA